MKAKGKKKAKTYFLKIESKALHKSQDEPDRFLMNMNEEKGPSEGAIIPSSNHQVDTTKPDALRFKGAMSPPKGSTDQCRIGAT